MKHTLSTLFASALAVAALLTAQAAEACTGIRLIARNGDVVFARTLEFATDIKSEVIMVPRGFARTGTAPGGKAGMRWTSRYASLGANGEKLPFIFDGLNEKGLAVGTFYFPGSAGFRSSAPRVPAEPSPPGSSAPGFWRASPAWRRCGATSATWWWRM